MELFALIISEAAFMLSLFAMLTLIYFKGTK